MQPVRVKAATDMQSAAKTVEGSYETSLLMIHTAQLNPFIPYHKPYLFTGAMMRSFHEGLSCVAYAELSIVLDKAI